MRQGVRVCDEGVLVCVSVCVCVCVCVCCLSWLRWDLLILNLSQRPARTRLLVCARGACARSEPALGFRAWPQQFAAAGGQETNMRSHHDSHVCLVACRAGRRGRGDKILLKCFQPRFFVF